MAAPTSLQNIVGQNLDTLYDDAGVAYIKAAGDSEGSPSGITPPAAPQLVQQAKSVTGTRSSVSAAVADTLVLAANTARKGATIFNESTAILYLGLGTTAVSTTSYTVQVPAGGYYEVPFSFSGQIRGYWAAANGSARVTELT